MRSASVKLRDQQCTALDILLKASPAAVELETSLNTIASIDQLPKELMPHHRALFLGVYRQSLLSISHVLFTSMPMLSKPIVELIMGYDDRNIVHFSGTI